MQYQVFTCSFQTNIEDRTKESSFVLSFGTTYSDKTIGSFTLTSLRPYQVFTCSFQTKTEDVAKNAFALSFSVACDDSIIGSFTPWRILDGLNLCNENLGVVVSNTGKIEKHKLAGIKGFESSLIDKGCITAERTGFESVSMNKGHIVSNSRARNTKKHYDAVNKAVKKHIDLLKQQIFFDSSKNQNYELTEQFLLESKKPYKQYIVDNPHIINDSTLFTDAVLLDDDLLTKHIYDCFDSSKITLSTFEEKQLLPANYNISYPIATSVNPTGSILSNVLLIEVRDILADSLNEIDLACGNLMLGNLEDAIPCSLTEIKQLNINDYIYESNIKENHYDILHSVSNADKAKSMYNYSSGLVNSFYVKHEYHYDLDLINGHKLNYDCIYDNSIALEEIIDRITIFTKDLSIALKRRDQSLSKDNNMTSVISPRDIMTLPDTIVGNKESLHSLVDDERKTAEREDLNSVIDVEQKITKIEALSSLVDKTNVTLQRLKALCVIANNQYLSRKQFVRGWLNFNQPTMQLPFKTSVIDSLNIFGTLYSELGIFLPNVYGATKPLKTSYMLKNNEYVGLKLLGTSQVLNQIFLANKLSVDALVKNFDLKPINRSKLSLFDIQQYLSKISYKNALFDLDKLVLGSKKFNTSFNVKNTILSDRLYKNSLLDIEKVLTSRSYDLALIEEIKSNAIDCYVNVDQIEYLAPILGEAYNLSSLINDICLFLVKKDDEAISTDNNLVADIETQHDYTLLTLIDANLDKEDRAILFEDKILARWEYFDWDMSGYDLLDIPNEDYSYENLISKILDEQGKPRAEYPLTEAADGSYIDVPFPLVHPIPNTKTVGTIELNVNLGIYQDVLLLLFVLWRENKFKISMMNTQQAMNFVISELDKFVNEKVKTLVAEDILKQYNRMIRMVRWYAEGLVLEQSNIRIYRGYKNWHDNIAYGNPGCTYVNNGWVFDQTGTMYTIKVPADIELKLESLASGQFSFTYLIDDKDNKSTLILIIDGDPYELYFPEPRPVAKRINVNVKPGVHKYKFSLQGQSGACAAIGKIMLTGAVFSNWETEFISPNTENTGMRDINELIGRLVYYYEQHHEKKTKGTRKIEII